MKKRVIYWMEIIAACIYCRDNGDKEFPIEDQGSVKVFNAECFRLYKEHDNNRYKIQCHPWLVKLLKKMEWIP